MTEALSVLLIIGAAVVGPIVGNTAVYVTTAPPGYSGCIESGPGYVPGKGGVPFCARVLKQPAESLDQLCERLMREIGAKQDRVMPRPFWMEGDDPTIHLTSWWVDSHRVTCIPTPAGYRR